jgi:hypothetical protein
MRIFSIRAISQNHLRRKVPARQQSDFKGHKGSSSYLSLGNKFDFSSVNMQSYNLETTKMLLLSHFPVAAPKSSQPAHIILPNCNSGQGARQGPWSKGNLAGRQSLSLHCGCLHYGTAKAHDLDPHVGIQQNLGTPETSEDNILVVSSSHGLCYGDSDIQDLKKIRPARSLQWRGNYNIQSNFKRI